MRCLMIVVVVLVSSCAWLEGQKAPARQPLQSEGSFRVDGKSPFTQTGFDLVPGYYYSFKHTGGSVCLEPGKRCAPPRGSDVPGDEAWGLKIPVGDELVQVRDGLILTVEEPTPLAFYVADGEELAWSESKAGNYTDNSGFWEIELSSFQTAPEPGWLRGISLTSYSALGYCSPDVEKLLLKLRKLGADAIQLVALLETAGKSIGPAEFSPELFCLIHASQLARKHGFKVAWNLHVDPDKPGWRGQLAPADHRQFIAEYGRVAEIYAHLAQAYKADIFVVATEMVSLTASEEDRNAWLEVFLRLHSIYFGTIVYAADRSEVEVLSVDFWESCCDAIGLTAWHTLTADPDPTVDQLSAAWKPIVATMKKMADETKMRILIAEGPGYRPIKGCATEPAEYLTGRPESRMCQVVGYEAFLQMFTRELRSHFLGFFAWEVSAPGEPPSQFSPLDSVTESTIRKSWTGAAAPAGK